MSSQSQKYQALLSLWGHLVHPHKYTHTHTHTHTHTQTCFRYNVYYCNRLILQLSSGFNLESRGD